MDDTLRVRGGEPLCDLDREFEGVPRRQRGRA